MAAATDVQVPAPVVAKQRRYTSLLGAICRCLFIMLVFHVYVLNGELPVVVPDIVVVAFLLAILVSVKDILME